MHGGPQYLKCGARGKQPIVVGAGMEIATVARRLVNHDGAH